MKGALSFMPSPGITLAEFGFFDRGPAGSLPPGWTAAMTHAEGRPKLATGKLTSTWHANGPGQNYPMALAEGHHRLFVMCCLPARLVVLNADDGRVVRSLSIVGDRDDLFYDAARGQIYAIGGEGAVTVVRQDAPDHYRELGRVTTISGARTGFYSRELQRLYVACRREGNQPAAIRVIPFRNNSLQRRSSYIVNVTST